jgi:hypothetical protein
MLIFCYALHHTSFHIMVQNISSFTANIDYPLHISLKPTLRTQFSRHTLSSLFDQCFHISVVCQNLPPLMSLLSRHKLMNYNCIKLQSLTRRLFQKFSHRSREILARHCNAPTAKGSPTERMSNSLNTIQFNFRKSNIFYSSVKYLFQQQNC